MTKNITKGEWKYNQTLITDFENKPIATTFINTRLRYIGSGEAEANAALIAEAGTVANETGKSPRELLNERNELVEAARLAAHWIMRKCDEDYEETPWRDLVNAIKKTEK